MKKPITAICVICTLFASSAHSDNIFEKLKRELERLEDTSTVKYVSISEATSPIILTVDGIDLFDKKQRYESSYLKPVVEAWAISSDVSYVGWSGDYAQTESELTALENRIVSAYTHASSDGRPFVMITHSWGTVLSYRALKNLYISGRLPKNAVHAFVTMGSPLSKADDPNYEGKKQAVGPNFAVDTGITGAVKKYGDWDGPEVLGEVVGNWRNYWIKSDKVSGPIPDAATNPATMYIGFSAHKAYYTAPSMASKIRKNLVADLETFVSPGTTVASSDTVNAQNTAAITATDAKTSSNSPLCFHESCIGDRLSKYANEDWATRFSFSRHFSHQFIGLSDEEFASLDGGKGRATKRTRATPALLGKIEVSCVPLRVAFNSQEVELTFSVKPSTDNWQGLQLTMIRKSYSPPADMPWETFEKSFLMSVGNQYPTANQEGSGIAYSRQTSGGRRYLLAFMDVNFSSNQLVPKLAAHPRCKAPESQEFKL